MKAQLLIGLTCLLALTTADYDTPSCDGRQVIVHLFEWKWTDVALECERFLAPNQFCGVQISPPQEHLVLTANPPYPWWQKYQPISYNLTSRSGNEAEFRDMVTRCNAVGVRIFADAVINHMAGSGSSGFGSAGTPFDADAYDFPGVPYEEADFTPSALCSSADGTVDTDDDPEVIRNCELFGLKDLYGGSEGVRQKVADYLNKLIDIGVAGFRLDAAKYMWPEDIADIQSRLNDLNVAQGFPNGTRPFFAQEVIDLGTGNVTVQEYYDTGRVTEFRYSNRLKEGIENFNKLWNISTPLDGQARTDKAFIFVDNHDTQRGHGPGGNPLTYKTPLEYKLAAAYLLAQDYGYTRLMSSYAFDLDDDAGPPHEPDYSVSDVEIGADGQCAGGWVCEHRWPSIGKMVQFRNAVAGTREMAMSIMYQNFVSLTRGRKGYFAMAKNGNYSETTFTDLPPGTYTELMTCNSVVVESDTSTLVEISNPEEPIFAICDGCVCL